MVAGVEAEFGAARPSGAPPGCRPRSVPTGTRLVGQVRHAEVAMSVELAPGSPSRRALGCSSARRRAGPPRRPAARSSSPAALAFPMRLRARDCGCACNVPGSRYLHATCARSSSVSHAARHPGYTPLQVASRSRRLLRARGERAIGIQHVRLRLRSLWPELSSVPGGAQPATIRRPARASRASFSAMLGSRGRWSDGANSSAAARRPSGK